MVSLHAYFINFNEYIYHYILFNNTLIFFLTFVYFIILIISIFLFNTYTTFSLNRYSSIIKQLYYYILFISIVLFFIKFFFYTWFFQSSMLVKFSNFTNLYYSNLLVNINTLGDILVILCILTTFISWVYLSERYLFLNMFNVYYFYIFIIFTINMVYTSNLLVMFIFFEFIFLPSLYFVYWLSYSQKSDKAIKYLLVWTLSGSFFVACGLAYIYGVIGTLSLTNLLLFKFTNLEKIMLFLCFFIGFGVKLPIWPFHYWLTKVHVEAPTGFSIFLSGYLVKTAFYCLVYFCYLFKTQVLLYFVLGIIFLGAIDASIRMWTSTDIKRLIAFATIQEMNLIVGFFFLLNNSYMQILNIFLLVHGILSTLLFFLVDQVQKRYQTRNIVVISGLAYKLPNLHAIIWGSILIFRGFPIFIKFFIEWELLAVLLNNFFIWGFIVFVLVSVYGVLGFCRIWLSILYGQPTENLNNTGDILHKDLAIAIYLISLLAFLSSLIFFF